MHQVGSVHLEGAALEAMNSLETCLFLNAGEPRRRLSRCSLVRSLTPRTHPTWSYSLAAVRGRTAVLTIP